MPLSRDSGGAEEEEEEEEEDGPGSLVEKETLDMALSVTKKEEEELEHMFEQVRVSAAKTEERLPKIMLSPRDDSSSAVSRPLRDKLADADGKGLMPSRSNPSTPRSSLGGSSGIPRFVRNPKARSLANGAVHRRVMQKQAGSPTETAASDFSRDKSRSSSSLSALRMKTSGSRKNSRSDTSINLIGCNKRSKEYGHVKSKVREYIDEVKRLSAASKRNNNKIGSNSFQLSPGKKSLSMSNLAAEEERSAHRQPSSRELQITRLLLKTFYLLIFGVLKFSTLKTQL